MAEQILTEKIIQYFAAKHLPPIWSIPDALSDPAHPCNRDLERAIELIEEPAINEFRKHPAFLHYSRDNSEHPERSIRIGLIITSLDTEILRRRNQTIREAKQDTRSQPYEHPALEGIAVEDHLLVDMSVFDTQARTLRRNGFVFQPLPVLFPALNSSYWLMSALYNPGIMATKRIRLDPFLVESAQGYSPMEYKMRVYGVPLDWDRIEALKEEEHARWIPDPEGLFARADIEHTDVVWSPRGSEIHFICEEVPRLESNHLRGSRYFHSIYDREKQSFIHADGALRFYSESELRLRHSTHVRHAGKAGTRIKVFQLDGDIDRETWCELAAAFYVWNCDVSAYFGAAVA